MELHHGRPDQMAGREDREIRVYDFLDSLGIEYWQTDHEKRAGDKPFKTKEIPPQIGSARLSFAPEEKMTEFLDIHPGAVSVMGLMNDQENHVQLLVDEDILEGEFLGCHPCVNTASLKIRTADVFGKFLEAVHHNYKKVHLEGK